MKYVYDGEINPEVADTLSELSNVGVGMASVALGRMIGTTISIGIPKVVSVESNLDEIIQDDPQKIAIGILMSMDKPLGGAVLFVIDSQFLSDLVLKLIEKQLYDDELVEDEESLSAISEVANIMAASYMKAIGAYTGIRIFLSPVMVGVDMLGALVTYPVAQMGIGNNETLCIDTSFAIHDGKESKTVGRVIMFPNEASVEEIIESLENRK